VSGHSKWSSIKHKKAATDAKRGQLFTKLAREITMAARQGGGDPEMNPTLRLAIARAKDNNVPNANIERAIQRATGGGDADKLEEITYEGFGPGGIAVVVEVVTDNRNRTVAEVRLAFSRSGGSLAETGAVGWQFEHRGLITVSAQDADPDEIQLTAIEAGALDVDTSEDLDTVDVTTEPGDLETVRQALTAAGFAVERAEIARVASTTTDVDATTAESAIRLFERLDELDDVTRVYSNAEFPDEVLAAVSG
jgi:YebC/PmpR family DNA-binding regulatory protein